MRSRSVRHIPLVARDGFLCNECDALWFDESTIDRLTFVDFGTYMMEHGGKGLWSELVLKAKES